MTHPSISQLAFVALAGLFAGTQNVLAGGGSFITFPSLLLAGLNPLAANMTSTIALFPNQVTSGLAGRRSAGGVGQLTVAQLFIISVVGGVAGAVLLTHTPVGIFTRLVPWLVLFATIVFIWGSFVRRVQPQTQGMSWKTLAAMQFAIAVYGGYFGGGIGILMLAALTVAGQPVRMAGATKNVLAMAMNASAVALFALAPQISWPFVLALGAGGVAGAFTGTWLMHRLPERVLRGFVVCVGLVLSVWLFLRH